MTMGQGLYGLPEPELPKKEIPAWRKKLRWPIRIVFWVLVFFSVCIFMLMRFGGANEDNREMLSRVMSDISGTDVRIGALNAASFYPLIGIDAERIAIYRPTDDGVQQIGSIDRANYATGFWSALRGRMDIRSLSLHGVRFYDGGITPLSLRIDRAVIDLDDPHRPALVVDGFYGDHILSGGLATCWSTCATAIRRACSGVGTRLQSRWPRSRRGWGWMVLPHPVGGRCALCWRGKWILICVSARFWSREQ